MSSSALKKHSTEEIEEAIAKALSDLCGEPLTTTIGEIAFEQNAPFRSATLTVLIAPQPVDRGDVPF